MRIVHPRRLRDPKLTTKTVMKVDRLEARIERLIRADHDAYDERVRVAARAAATDGVPRLADGRRDRRTSAYRAWKAARDADALAAGKRSADVVARRRAKRPPRAGGPGPGA